MRAILVDDEYLMLKSFMRCSADIPEINVIGQFDDAESALAFAKENPFELALLDIEMPKMNGIELAVKLRELDPDLLVVFISAYGEYLRDSNIIGGDDYIVKPYKKETIERMAKKMVLLSKRQQKDIYLQMFGKFNVLKHGVPLPLTGKTKEILALIACKRGKEISNEEIYTVVWEGREYSNEHMKTYYNAISRLKRILADSGVENLLISTARGQMLNMEMCDCDYFDWLDKKGNSQSRFEGEFLSEYSWGESTLAGLLNMDCSSF